MRYIRIFDRKKSNDTQFGRGRRFCFDLDDGSADKLLEALPHASKEGVALSIFEDGSIMLSDNVYDYRTEEYRETVLKYYEGKEKEDIVVAIDRMLTLDPLVRGGQTAAENYKGILELMKEEK